MRKLIHKDNLDFSLTEHVQKSLVNYYTLNKCRWNLFRRFSMILTYYPKNTIYFFSITRLCVRYVYI